jgi:hypothetical protein
MQQILNAKSVNQTDNSKQVLRFPLTRVNKYITSEIQGENLVKGIKISIINERENKKNKKLLAI